MLWVCEWVCECVCCGNTNLLTQSRRGDFPITNRLRLGLRKRCSSPCELSSQVMETCVSGFLSGVRQTCTSQPARSGLPPSSRQGLRAPDPLTKTHKTSYLFGIVSPLECSCCHLSYFADFIGSKMSRYNHPSVRRHKTRVSLGSRSCTWWAGCIWTRCCHCRPLCRFLTQTGGNVGESHHVTAPPLFYSPSAPGVQLPLSPPSPAIPRCKLPPLPLLPTYSFSKSHRNNGCSFSYALNISD